MKQIPMPVIYPRSVWGAKPADTSRMKRHTIRTITVHHSGIAWYGDPLPAGKLRRLQDFSLNEKGWPDVPYHYKIDLEGRIWEARDIAFAGDTNTTYDPSGHALICVMGNFEEQIPTPGQIESLVHLCAWLCRVYNMDPRGIRGHKDYAETLCPGANLYPMISGGELASRVEDMLREF